MASASRKILKYTLLPGFWPRFRALFTSGFTHIAYNMALVYCGVRLLPRNHPYLEKRNIGRYGIRHVIAEAASNLVFSRRNADQIVIFFTIIAGLVLLASQFALLIVALIAQQPALAAGITDLVPTAQNLLGVNSVYGHAGNQSQDLAFILLDRIFGLKPQMFGSCISTGVPCTDLNGNNLPGAGNYPFPFHTALHELLRFYSYGIFFVSVIVILYFVMTIIGETAVTGSPFGQRFNETWAPVRLLLFFALLMPLSTGDNNAGLNGAQVITFWSAKFGSNFATNAWGRFNDVLTGTYLGPATNLIAKVNAPEVNTLMRFVFVAKTCQLAENFAYEHKPEGVKAYLVRDALSNASLPGADFLELEPASYQTAVNFVNKGNIEIRFGVRNPDEHPLEKGNVRPLCGSLTIPVTSPEATGLGAYAIQELYYDMLKDMWMDPQVLENAKCLREMNAQDNPRPECTVKPNADFATGIISFWQQYIELNLPALIVLDDSNWDITPRLRRAGWAGAAIWYNRLAQMNGEITSAASSLPFGKEFPYVMKVVAKQNQEKNPGVSEESAFNPALGGETTANYDRVKDAEIATILYTSYSFWERTNTTRPQKTRTTGNAFIDGVNLLFGTDGIFSMRDNTNVHPLAQLSALGKGMMNAAMANLVVGAAGGAGGGILKNFIGDVARIGGDFLFTMGKATILMSFILYYVLPSLPFIYFMFAVSRWVKTIFEAIVAMPLWALAHISRLDGEGIAGPGATSGYFLLLEIFLRPILILFGLLASISIFAASVNILNDVFKIVAVNVSGFDMDAAMKDATMADLAYYRGPVDKFFYTALYVIMCYMMALGFFKMIDQVPSQILRWMGISTPTFNEDAGDPASELTGRVYTGGSLALGQIQGGGQLAALLGRR